MRSTFQAWLDTLVNDDGSGETGTLVDKNFVEDLLDLIDSELVTVGVVITEDTTFYVDPSGSDVTGDGSATYPWATPQHACEVAADYIIPPGTTVTIQCADGTYVGAEIHYLPKGVLLTAENFYTKAVSSIQSSSGSAGAYSIVLNLDSVADIAVNDYVLINGFYCSGGTNPKYLAGCYQVTNVNAINTRITITSTHYIGVPSGLVTATLYVIKVMIENNVGGYGIYNPTGGTASKIVFKGDATPLIDGIAIFEAQYSCTLSYCGIVNFGQAGVSVLNAGSLIMQNCCVSDCSNGLSVGVPTTTISGIIAATTCTISGNAAIGVQTSRGGRMNLLSTTITGNNGGGLFAADASFVYASSLMLIGNNTSTYAGVYCLRTANVNLNSSTVTETAALYAGKCAYIDATSASISGTVSPAYNTLGNENAYIDN